MEAIDPDFKPTLFHDSTLPDHFDTNPFGERIIEITSNRKDKQLKNAVLNDFKFQKNKLYRLQKSRSRKSGVAWTPYDSTNGFEAMILKIPWKDRYDEFDELCKSRNVELKMTEEEWEKKSKRKKRRE